MDVVELDVIATNRDGQPVMDLSPGDVEIFEDDRHVEVASFRLVQLPAAPVRPSLPASPGPGVVLASNGGAADGRLVIVVLDRPDRKRFRRVKQTVLAILDHVGPGDQVAMLSNGGSSEYQVEFTRDTSRIKRALDSRAVMDGGSDRLLRVLTRLADALRPIAGRRKIVAVISEGPPELPRSLQLGEENHVPDFQAFLTSALRANLAVYAFNPRYAFDLDTMTQAESVVERTDQLRDEADGIFGLPTIASSTGGRATVRTNAFEAEVARMFAETASYYLIAYYARAPQDGKFHRILVRSRRAGVDLRTRSGYLSPKISPATTVVASVERLASAPVQSGGLPLRMVAVAVPGKSRKGRVSSVHVVVEIDGAALEDADALELKALGVDMAGRVRAMDRFAGRLRDSLKGEDARWLRVPPTLDLPPGRYQLRVAAARSDRRAGGSVFDEIEVPDFREELAVGGLVLGTPAASENADGVARYLRCLPMATRDVHGGMTVRACVPLQVSSRLRPARVLFLGTLVGPAGDARQLVRLERRLRSQKGGGFDFDLPLQSLTPGDYELRLDVVLGERSVHRQLSFRVSSGPY